MIITEGIHTGEFLLSEANGTLSREQVTFAAGAALISGTVVGKATKAGTATATATAGNTGNPTFGTIALSAGALAGAYSLTFTAATKFTVEDPLGVTIGNGTVGSAFAKGGLGFTITAGGTAAVAGDSFTIAVATGSGDWAAYDGEQTDGTEEAAGVLYAPLAASESTRPGVVIVRHAEVAAQRLTGNDAAGTTALAAHGVIVR